MSASNINKTLPPRYGPNFKQEAAYEHVKELLNEILPQTDKSQIETEQNWRFPLEKIREEKKRKPKSTKKKLLTRNEKKKLGLLKLPKGGWDYSKILPMNKIWKEYMYENLELVKRAPHHTESDYNSFCAVLNKSELIGAEISIIRSKVPSYVAESKFKIITKDACVFIIQLRNMKFTVYGKSLLTRPSDRSIKKIKSYVFPDL
ncbi:ribonuclease p subunit p29 [Holotrichia oblita]|uniref:Ribonuclease p subunit p29 n=1 Tax=Holotrichia oblita TaxID=644536 RepID=A0ACB9SJM8_HOLOL|nr:ribonuclease p subunit p29 [Holotrichia oblita]